MWALQQSTVQEQEWLFTRELGNWMKYYCCFIVCIYIEPSTAPKNVTVTRPSPTVMVVSWIPLNYSEARGFISHYTVTYTPVISGRKRQALTTTTKTVPGTDASATRIEGLDPETDYIVQVSATNGAGTSELSPVMIVSGIHWKLVHKIDYYT